MKKEKCLEDYHRRFGHAESLERNGAKTADMVIRRSIACKWVRLIKCLQTEPDLLCKVITGDKKWIFKLRNKIPEQ